MFIVPFYSPKLQGINTNQVSSIIMLNIHT